MKKLKVLLVDDNPLPLALGKDILETGGYEVITANDGLMALQLLPHHVFAAVITDILMPDMDGYSLCYKIRSNEKNDAVRVVVYSATYISPDDEKLAVEFGANGIIAKPSSREVFLATLKEVISNPQKNSRIVTPQTELLEVTRLYNSQLVKRLEKNHYELQIAQRELVKSESRFRALVENIADAVSLHDRKGNVLYQSSSVARITGYSQEEAKAMSMVDFFHPDEIPVILKQLETVLNSPGIPVHSIKRFRHKEGHYIWTEGTTTNLLTDDNVHAIVANFRDITNHKLANEKIDQNQKRLEAERERFADLFLQAPSCICILAGKEHIYEMANPLYMEITGKKDLVGKTALEVFPELVEQGFLALLDNVYKTGVPVSGKEMLIQIDQDGDVTDHYMDFVYQPYRDHDGVIAGIFFFANLVTEEVLARKRTEQRENYYRALVENAVDLIVVTDKNGKLTYVSPALEKLTGRSSEGSEMPIFSSLLPDDEFESKDLFNELLDNPGIPISQSSRLRCKDGSYIWVEGIICNLLDDENVRGIVGNFRDITERRLHEERLINANRLYAFISQINQTIVHITDESELYKAACRIATEIGKYKIAWIGVADTEGKKINLVESSGMNSEQLLLFHSNGYENGGPQDRIISNGSYYVCNDIENDLEPESWKPFAAKQLLRSAMVLPIKKSGKTFATFNIYSSDKNLFDAQEIALLKEVAGDISFAIDVFEKEKHRKQLENKIIHSELRLKQAQAIAHFGSWELDLSTGISIWSEEACNIYGFPAEENTQSYATWVSCIHPDDLEHVLKITKEAQNTLCSSAIHHRIVRKDGTIRYIYSQTQFEFNREGKAIGLTGVAHDETEMKDAEKSLEQSEMNLRLIMDMIPQSIFAKNAQGKFVFTNKSYAALYGVAPMDMINKSAWDNIPVKSELISFREEDNQVLASGKSITIHDQNFTDYKGKKFLFHTVKVPFIVAGTGEPAVLGITTDITAQKLAEDERTKIIADMVHRNNDLEQFSYIVSHNLRAPVANILGLVNIMQTIGLEKEEVKTVTAFLDTAVKNLDHVLVDLNRILALKNNAGENRECVNFADLLSEVRLSIDTRDNNEMVSITGNFIAIEEMTTVKSYLYSIFFNLILNGIKYRRPHTPSVIEITSAKTGSRISITFKDNGLGIDLKRIGTDLFRLYKRFHNHVEGKGMGLFMVKTQVELLGGKISVASIVNHGSEFTIEFEERENVS